VETLVRTAWGRVRFRYVAYIGRREGGLFWPFVHCERKTVGPEFASSRSPSYRAKNCSILGSAEEMCSDGHHREDAVADDGHFPTPYFREPIHALQRTWSLSQVTPFFSFLRGLGKGDRGKVQADPYVSFANCRRDILTQTRRSLFSQHTKVFSTPTTEKNGHLCEHPCSWGYEIPSPSRNPRGRSKVRALFTKTAPVGFLIFIRPTAITGAIRKEFPKIHAEFFRTQPSGWEAVDGCEKLPLSQVQAFFVSQLLPAFFPDNIP